MKTHPGVEATDATFAQVLEGSATPVLVDFTAAWCPPCRAMAPHLERLAQEYEGRLTVVTLDVDANPETAAKYGISAMPTLLVFKAGRVLEQAVGGRGLAALKQLVDPHLA